jgi:SAM-dependent methyltransferase
MRDSVRRDEGVLMPAAGDAPAPASWESAVAWLVAQPGQTDLVRACYYDPPLAVAARRYHASEEWAAVRAMLPTSGGLALDLGAGNGIASYALARDGWRVVAVEPDPSAVVGAGAIRALAASEGLDITVLEGAGERIDLPSASVDLVFARQVLHHANDLRQLCREAARVLRPGGTFVAAREHVLSRASDLPAFLRGHPLHRLYGGEHAYVLRDYRTALRDAGLVILRELRPLESVVNFAPLTRASLRGELQARLRRLPMGSAAARLLDHERIYDAARWLAARVDDRPGRLFTFVCKRPA